MADTNFSPGTTVASAWLNDVAGTFRNSLANTADTAKGDALVGVRFPATGGVARTQDSKNQDVVTGEDFGATGDNLTDNTAAFAAMVAWASTFTPTATVPRIRLKQGIYRYATSPNWAVQNLVLDCERGVVFKHTGAGVAFNLDGGAAGPGVYAMRVLGGPRISGNAATTHCVYSRAVHHSYFDFEARDCAQEAVKVVWNVCNEFRIRVSPLGSPAMSPVPTTGLLLDSRGGLGELTSACTFHNPIFEGISAYGINLANAIQNTFIGGTSESNGSGVFISGTSSQNTFINLDCEFNTVADIVCNGTRNTFHNILSDKSSTFAGISNYVLGGNYNIILAQGTGNEFHHVDYASNFGTFTDTGTATIKRSVRNLVTSTLDPELVRNAHMITNYTGAAGVVGLASASMDQLNGGSTSDHGLWKYSTGQIQFWLNNVKNVSMGPSTIGFYGTTPIIKPTGVAVTAAGIHAALVSLGLIAP
jgi:hypothetical protein